ncbi:unnamed protein product [Calypogeia fissa]
MPHVHLLLCKPTQESSASLLLYTQRYHGTDPTEERNSQPEHVLLPSDATRSDRSDRDEVDEGPKNSQSEFLLLPSDAIRSDRSDRVAVDERPKSSLVWYTKAEGEAKREYRVTEFGAQGNGLGFDTVPIQAAIDACASQNGGVVRFPPGRYLTATIFLKSNITVWIDSGATILGSPYQRDYPPERNRWYVILAEDAENVKVTGGGTIDGQGLEFVTTFDPRMNVMVSWNTTGDCSGDECRSRLIGFVNCKNVKVWDVYLHEPAYWCLNIVRSNDVLIENITIYGDFNSPNNDGIDIEGSNNTVIRGCHIDTGDDAICPKTATAPLYNLTVSDCWIRTKSCAVKLGSGSSFDFHALRFERLKIVDSHRGLGFQIRDSGSVSDVTFANIEIATRCYDPSWWGRAEPIYITACPRNPSTVVGSIAGVQFINISATSENGNFLAGSQSSLLSNVVFHNVSLSYKNSDSPPESLYHDYRPGCQGLVLHPSSGLFMEYASDIIFKDVTLNWAANVTWNLPLELTPTTVGNLKLVDFVSQMIS